MEAESGPASGTRRRWVSKTLRDPDNGFGIEKPLVTAGGAAKVVIEVAYDGGSRHVG